MTVQSAYRSRTQFATFLPLVVFGLGLFALQDRGREWMGEWLWTVDVVGVSLFLTGPIIAAVAALDAAVRLRSSAYPLTATAPRVRRDWFGVWCWLTGCAIAGHLASTAVALTMTYADGAALSPALGVHLDGSVGVAPILGIGVQLAGLGFYAAFGMAIGLVLPRALGPVVALAVVVALNLTLFNGTGGFGFLSFGGATASPAGSAFSIGFLGAQFLILAVLTALLLVAVCAVEATARRFTAAGIGALLLSAALGVTTYAVGPERRFVEDPRLVAAMACTSASDGPLVCVNADHLRVLDQVARIVGDTYASAIGRGLPAEALFPQLIEQISDAPAPEPGGFVLPDRSFRRPLQVSADHLVGTIAIGWHCPAETKAGAAVGYEDQSAALAGWLAADPDSRIGPAEAARLLDKLKRCDFR